MHKKDDLRPVKINYDGNIQKGYFHRFVYMMHAGSSETKVLVELEDGRLRYFDPFFVQFTDRTSKPEKEVIVAKRLRK